MRAAYTDTLSPKRSAVLLGIVPIVLALAYICLDLEHSGYYTFEVLYGVYSPYCSVSFFIATIAEVCMIFFVNKRESTRSAVSKWLSLFEIMLLFLTIGYLLLWLFVRSNDAAILRLGTGTIPSVPLFCFGAVAVLQIAFVATNRRSVLGVGSHCLWIAILDMLLQVSVFRGIDAYDVRFLSSIATFWLPALIGSVLLALLPLILFVKRSNRNNLHW